MERQSLKARLVCSYTASPFPSSQNFLGTKPTQNPKRKSHVNLRMVNHVRSKSIDREREEIYHYMKRYLSLQKNDKDTVRKVIYQTKIMQKSFHY